MMDDTTLEQMQQVQPQDTERIYNDHIRPLIEQVIDLAYMNNIPIVFAAQIATTSEGETLASYCLTNTHSAQVLQAIKGLLTPNQEVEEFAGKLAPPPSDPLTLPSPRKKKSTFPPLLS